ncbi:hypothetical protein P875_00064666 [Aspergillus parasiticus SU-1]|uniref:Uncharacterized protein n=1 Tax=Aspergillus parasiticus (strain ATCC 56775 / NRRL 5862 / SRRC 143 / SU-1) TaxID=1403190 RepID=A0A0F0I7Z7_ASPPU|nr:hypothetical protein P875_00064666 [Aspergillus parasiticus SU-1]
MGKLLVKLIGSGIGFTSEAIHAARNRSSNHGDTYPSQPSSRGRQGYAELPAYPERAELPAYPGGIAELPASSDDNQQSKGAEAGYNSNVYGESKNPDDLERGVNEDEAVWELDETAQKVRLPTYEESQDAPTTAGQTEEAKEEEKENMVRGLVQMAGPVQTVQRIPCPVIIPQRRPGNKDRGFVRAYAPVLADCGINQDVFLNFLEDFFQASKASPWIEVVYVAAGVVGFFPETAAQITSIIIQTVAGTAHSPSGKTHGLIELPEAAPLVYPDLDRAAARAMEGNGREAEKTREKMKSAGAWVQDYMDRKAQASYEAKNPGSSLAVPESGRKGFVSRYNDANHPVNNGKLTSVLTGGLIGSKPGLIERAATSIRESQDSKRIARGEPPSEPIKEKWQRYQRKKKPSLAKKLLQQDVLFSSSSTCRPRKSCSNQLLNWNISCSRLDSVYQVDSLTDCECGII